MNGKLFVIEGVDGSGKQTQSALMYEKLLQSGRKVIKISFPNYDSDSSALVKMYLGGEFGTDPDDVSAYVSSIFFAADRYATFKKSFEKYYNSGYIIIADRYTTSNMVHQASKIDDLDEKEKFLDWLCDLEFNIFAIPAPTKVFFLNTEPAVSLKLITQRDNKITHEKEKDIHEQNKDYIYKSYQNAQYLIKKYAWQVINCTINGEMLGIEEINNKLMKAVGEYLE